jgi:hypothetical protein
MQKARPALKSPVACILRRLLPGATCLPMPMHKLHIMMGDTAAARWLFMP